MKTLTLTILLIFSSFSIFGQEAKVTTDKKKYKLDEIIEVTFELNAKSDSMDLPEFNGFEIIGGPTESSSVTIEDGEMIVRESRTYKLQPVRRSRLKINSPVYFIDGRKIKGKPVKIKVD